LLHLSAEFAPTFHINCSVCKTKSTQVSYEATAEFPAQIGGVDDKVIAGLAVILSQSLKAPSRALDQRGG
jgi:hypothetical protein